MASSYQHPSPNFTRSLRRSWSWFDVLMVTWNPPTASPFLPILIGRHTIECMLDLQTDVYYRLIMQAESRTVGTKASLAQCHPVAVLQILGSTKAPHIPFVPLQDITNVTLLPHLIHVENNICIYFCKTLHFFCLNDCRHVMVALTTRISSLKLVQPGNPSRLLAEGFM